MGSSNEPSSMAGNTLSVDASFTSATTRSTTTVTTTGAPVVIPVAGAITDDYWRVRTANVTGTFSVAVAVGIK